MSQTPTDRLTETISAIHDSPTRSALAITGGGSRSLSRLLTVPGASRTVIEGLVPYSSASLSEYLGRRPDRFCDEATALAMAVVAHGRAVTLSEEDGQEPKLTDSLIGLGATASLASDRPKRGDHRALVALQTNSTTVLAQLDLEKNARRRSEEEDLVAELIIGLLATESGVQPQPELPLTDADRLDIRRTVASPELADVWNRRQPIAWSLPNGNWSLHPTVPPAGILSGSFAPRHQGHVELQQAAESILDGPVHYELPAVNADKPPLDFRTIETRRAAFTDRPLAITSAPTFAEKAELFPGTSFVIGADTAIRVIDPRFYDDDPGDRDAALAKIADHNCRFLVAGRMTDNRFLDLQSLKLPSGSESLFSEISADVFRCDVSSTELRNAARDA